MTCGNVTGEPIHALSIAEITRRHQTQRGFFRCLAAFTSSALMKNPILRVSENAPDAPSSICLTIQQYKTT
jgi:hypothetical protein